MTEAQQRTAASRAVDGPRTPPPWDRAGRPPPTGNWWARGLSTAELFAAAARAGLSGAAEEYRAARANVVRRIERRGPVCGTPRAVRTPGLLTGLAGVGHGLLRIAAPDLIAPVLLLARSTGRALSDAGADGAP